MALATATTAALIAAGSSLGAAGLQHRSASNAANAQAKAARDAINYQREQEFMSRLDARNQYDSYMRSVYGDRYQPAGRTAPAASTFVPPPLPTPAAGAPVAPTVVAPLPTAQPEVAPPLVGAPATPVPQSMADLTGGWTASNYSRYLGGRR